MILIVGAIVLLFGFVVFFGAPYVPSKKRDLKRALGELYIVDEDDLLVDLGSGDGVVLREAARRGAKAVGYELNPALVLIARLLSLRQKGVQVKLQDYRRARFPEGTTVVYTFGESRDIAKMALKVHAEAKRLGHPLMFISYGFAVPGQTPLRQAGPHYLYKISP